MELVVKPPTVPDLIACPELAALHALDVVLDAAVTALRAAHADVFWDQDIGFEQWPNYDAIRAAKEVLRDARKLRSALRRYQPDRTPPWAAQQLNLDPGEDVPF